MAVAAVHGLAVTGRAVAEAFTRRGYGVRVADDTPTADHARFAEAIGASVHDVSTAGGIGHFLDGVDVLVPAPGVPPHSAVIMAALSAGVPVRSETKQSTSSSSSARASVSSTRRHSGATLRCG